jgi:DNA (cytosine-5)-methyltransferase 1
VFVIGGLGVPSADVQALVDRALEALPRERNVDLIDILDLGSRFREYSPAEVERHLAMMSAEQHAKVEEKRLSNRPVAGPFARRMRDVPGSDKRVQRVEARFDGVANALRVASTGGSSKQFVMIVHGPETRMRAINPREAVRLMDIPDG